PRDRAAAPLVSSTSQEGSTQHLVLLEPGCEPLPGVLGGLLAVARPVTRMEAVRRVLVDLEPGSQVLLMAVPSVFFSICSCRLAQRCFLLPQKFEEQLAHA